MKPPPFGDKFLTLSEGPIQFVGIISIYPPFLLIVQIELKHALVGKN